jgi:hypothetical protein
LRELRIETYEARSGASNGKTAGTAKAIGRERQRQNGGTATAKRRNCNSKTAELQQQKKAELQQQKKAELQQQKGGTARTKGRNNDSNPAGRLS